MQVGFTFSFRNEFRETSGTLHFVIIASELNAISYFHGMVAKKKKKPCAVIDVNNEIEQAEHSSLSLVLCLAGGAYIYRSGVFLLNYYLIWSARTV